MQLHVSYLRALEDSPRTRAACLIYLGNWLQFFDPGRPDIIAKARELAATLGGTLKMSGVRPKYAWLEKFFGRRAAYRAQALLPNVKTSLMRAWDKTMYHLERRTG
jgi:hypothetical protein